jgi:hypothetical protein
VFYSRTLLRDPYELVRCTARSSTGSWESREGGYASASASRQQQQQQQQQQPSPAGSRQQQQQQPQPASSQPSATMMAANCPTNATNVTGSRGS